jgi:hypothetical protein
VLSVTHSGLRNSNCSRQRVGAAPENFPMQKRRKVLVPCAQEKQKPKRCHKEQFVPLPKSPISTFADGGQIHLWSLFLELFSDSVFLVGIGWYFPGILQPMPKEVLVGTFWYQ